MNIGSLLLQCHAIDFLLWEGERPIDLSTGDNAAKWTGLTWWSKVSFSWTQHTPGLGIELPTSWLLARHSYQWIVCLQYIYILSDTIHKLLLISTWCRGILTRWKRKASGRSNNNWREREEWAVIHIWKILKSMTPPKFGNKRYTNHRNGGYYTIPKISSSSQIRTLYCGNLGFKGPQLLNNLPKNKRDLQEADLETF